MEKLITYSVNEAEIAKMSNIYMGLTVEDINDTESCKSVHSARMIMVTHRVSIDKLRKSTNKDAQEFIKTNNKNAANLVALMKPIEDHLVVEEKIQAVYPIIF